MALLSALVKAVADVEGIDEVQVGWVARHLREAGLLTQAGRGRGAAHMNCADAANLLIGVNAATSAKDSASSVRLYRALPCGKVELRSSDGLGIAFRKGMTFGESLEQLLRLAAAEGGEPSQLEHDIFRASHYCNGVIGDAFRQLLKERRAEISKIIYSEITFTRPYRNVSVEIGDDCSRDAFGNDIPYEAQAIAKAEFWDATSEWPISGDRDERVRISIKTILTVGSVLNS